MTATLDTILDAQGGQMTIDEYLALERDEAPPEPVPPVTAGADSEGIMAIEGGAVATERAEIGPELHDGDCPYTQHCETRRRRLPTYRPGHPCHWAAWGDWRRCPIFRNGGYK